MAMTKGVLGKLMIVLLAIQMKRSLAVRKLPASPVTMTVNHLGQAWVGPIVKMLNLLGEYKWTQFQREETRSTLVYCMSNTASDRHGHL